MRNPTPLDSIERYLWAKFNEFPRYVWNKPHPPETALHTYYREGWELVNHLKMRLFEASSSFGNDWPFAIEGQLIKRLGTPLFKIKCQFAGCLAQSECVINEVRTGKSTKRHDGKREDTWRRLPNAPVFYCFPHQQESVTGKKYVPPTKAERLEFQAMTRAISRMHEERPAKPLQLDCGLKVDLHVDMDRDYLTRFVEVFKEERKKVI